MTAADVFMDSVPVNTENKKENNHNKVNFFFPEKWLFLQYVSAEEKHVLWNKKGETGMV